MFRPRTSRSLRRRAAATALLVLAAGALRAAARPVEADEGVAGLSLTLGTALSQFPCPASGETQPCTATITTGSASGRLAGTTDRVWEGTIADATVTGSLSFGDDPLVPCAAGSAAGSVTVSADDVHVFGTYQDSPLPRLVSGLTATFRLEWTRTGTTVKLAVRDAVVTLQVVGLGPVEVVSTGQGEGNGEFVVDDDGLPGCIDRDDAGAASSVVSGRVSVFEDRLPSVPQLLVPEPPPASYEFGQPEVFSVNATDPDGDPYKALITIRDALTGELVTRFETRLVPSGVDSTGRPASPLLPKPYRWTAEAIDVRGGRGPVSEERSFEVKAGALALLPL